MNLTRFIRFATAAVALASLSNGASASPEAWERANDEYQVQHYAKALEIYAQIAATGDARAAEVAGHMLVLGEDLYGDLVRRDMDRAIQLLSQAAHAGRPIATHLLRQVNLATVAKTANK